MGQHLQLSPAEAPATNGGDLTLPNLEVVTSLAPLPLGEDLSLEHLEQAHDVLLQAASVVPDKRTKVSCEIAAIGIGFEIGMHPDTKKEVAESYFGEGSEDLQEILEGTEIPIGCKIKAGLLQASVPLFELRREKGQSQEEKTAPTDDLYDTYVTQLAVSTQRALSARQSRYGQYRAVAGVPLLAALGDATILESLPYIATARERCHVVDGTHPRQHLAHTCYFVDENGKMPVRVGPSIVGEGNENRVLTIHLSHIVQEQADRYAPALNRTYDRMQLTGKVLGWAVAKVRGSESIGGFREEIIYGAGDAILSQVAEAFPANP